MESTLQKLAAMTEGKPVIMSDTELDTIAPFDVSNLVRSRPNPKRVGTKDTWECWIEQRDLKRFEDMRKNLTN